MAATHPSHLAEIRKKIADSISQTFHKFVKSERQSVEEALSLLASDKTIHPESTKVILDFYKKGEDQRRAFFTILAALDARKADYILNQIYAAMDTPEWLIQLRADLHALIKKMVNAKCPGITVNPLKELSNVFTDHFARIFNFQYLMTRCCNSKNTSIALLKFISEKEGVHPTEHWWNFENRLNSPDHIIISLEHFKMPYVPLVYIEVALSKGLIKEISNIIGEKGGGSNIRYADTAIFYSVNTTLAGLDGIALGAKIIIRATEYIERNYPRIKNFATLSPSPQLGSYLTTVLNDGVHSFSLTRGKIDANKKGRFISPDEINKIRAELSKKEKDVETLSISQMFKKVLSNKEWYENPVFCKALEHPLVELTKYYLLREKKIDNKTKARTTAVYDQVANFHLSNGAFIGSINYLADTSERGMMGSFGMMVNYIYDRRRLEKNKLLYGTGRVMTKGL